uniref:Uncharacterized protein n=1 Tax=Stylonychia lemnae TaxID=5949 RepID=A0A3S6K260_STYLE|nr:hypothetical protein [Stylonychia lemnae]
MKNFNNFNILPSMQALAKSRKSRKFFFFLKKKFDFHEIRKWQASRLLFKKFNKNKNNCVDNNSRFMYPKVYRKINKYFLEFYFINSFQNHFTWVKRTLKNFKYHICVTFIKKRLIFAKSKLNDYYSFSDNARKKNLLSFINFYFTFFKKNSFDAFVYCSRKKLKKEKFFFNLVFTFKNRRLLLNLQDESTKNLFYFSPGFFIKFFEKKKSLKKNKSLKMLSARYLRKLYIFTKIKYSIFHIKKTPVGFLEFLSSLNTPIIHKFNDPFTNKLVEEKSNPNQPLVNVIYFIFSRNIDFSSNKIRKKGRIKRKITRKLVLENSISD